MELRVCLKQIVQQSYARCSPRKQLLHRCFWTATSQNYRDKSTSQFARCFSSNHQETIIQSTRPKVEFPVTSLSDFMFSRFGKFGNKPALVSKFRTMDIFYIIVACSRTHQREGSTVPNITDIQCLNL